MSCIEANDQVMVGRLIDALIQIQDVAFAYLFGSRARGAARAESDVDLALMLRGDLAVGDTYTRIKVLAPILMPITGDRLDLVFLDRADPLLAHQVLKHGVLIHEKDPVARVRFYVRAVGEYMDTAPMRKIHTDATMTRAREGRTAGRSGNAGTPATGAGKTRA